VSVCGVQPQNRAGRLIIYRITRIISWTEASTRGVVHHRSARSLTLRRWSVHEGGILSTSLMTLAIKKCGDTRTTSAIEERDRLRRVRRTVRSARARRTRHRVVGKQTGVSNEEQMETFGRLDDDGSCD
jgi:hypothetical protein